MSEEPPLPNILWIVGESLDLGIYGEENVATPNLDRLYTGKGERETDQSFGYHGHHAPDGWH